MGALLRTIFVLGLLIAPVTASAPKLIPTKTTQEPNMHSILFPPTVITPAALAISEAKMKRFRSQTMKLRCARQLTLFINAVCGNGGNCDAETAKQGCQKERKSEEWIRSRCCPNN